MQLTPWPGEDRSPSRRESGPPAVRGLGRIDYVPAERVGFDLVPDPVDERLRQLGLIGPSPFCAGCARRPVVRRRRDGSAYETGEAFWLDTEHLLSFSFTRAVVRVGPRSFRPPGRWRLDGELVRFAEVGGPVRSNWMLEGDVGGGNGTVALPVTHPLDVLPPELARPLRGGKADAWMEYGDGWTFETVVAVRTGEDRVLALRAARREASGPSTATPSWRAETLDARVVDSRCVSFGADRAPEGWMPGP